LQCGSGTYGTAGWQDERLRQLGEEDRVDDKTVCANAVAVSRESPSKSWWFAEVRFCTRIPTTIKGIDVGIDSKSAHKLFRMNMNDSLRVTAGAKIPITPVEKSPTRCG
jgi:hypothetical protein